MVIASTKVVTGRMGVATNLISIARMHSGEFVPIGNQIHYNT
jgi:hypothetical protein